jgi:hypothetical protein
MRSVHHTTAIVLMCAALPACTTMLDNTQLRGSVTVDQTHDRFHGAPIRVAFRARAEGEQQCQDDLSACLRQGKGRWDELRSCSVKAAEQASAMRITIGANEHHFDACTGAIDAALDVEVLAFIDLDDDGALSPGEPYGLRVAGKAAPKLAPLTVAIDREL